MPKLKIIVLDCAYDTISEPATQEILGKVAALKIFGYRASHGYGILPVDSTDFVGKHTIVCEETPDGDRVLAATKSITIRCCDMFRIGLPMVNTAKACKDPYYLDNAN